MLEEIHIPTDIAQAVEILTSRKSIGIIAGGTLVMGEFNTHPNDLLELVSLAQVDNSVREIKINGSQAQVGAASPIAALGDHPELAFLHPAIQSIGSPTLRNMATVGGNFFAKDGYGDLAACFIALDARCTFLGAKGEREVCAELAIHGAMADEILVSIAFAIPEAGNWRYLKAMRRKANSVSIATIAALIETKAGVVESCRVAIGGAAPLPVRATHVEAKLQGDVLDFAAAEEAGLAALKDVQTYTDAYASSWYRQRVLPVHVRRALIGE